MTGPRIKYDIEANTQGEAEVAKLVAQLEKIDDAINPQAAVKAKALADELNALTGKRAAVQSFLEGFAAANTAGKNLDTAQQALQRLERQLEGVQTPTRAQAGQLQKLGDAATKAQSAFTAQTETLNRARGVLDGFGVSTQGLDGAQDRLSESIRGTSAEAKKLVAGYQQTGDAAKASASKQTDAQRSVSDSVGGIARQLSQLQALAGAALGGTFIGQIGADVARTADEYNNLAARIRLVTGEGAAFDSAFEGVFDVATRTGAALETTGTLFYRIAQAGKAFNLSQRDALALTESITQAVAVSGASAQASEASLTQLIQGLQSGVLRGEEFNSVMEQSPRLAQALADGLGLTTGELRKLSQQGALTTDVVIKALQGQAATLQKEFDQLPATVGRALQNLSTEWIRYIGESDKATGASSIAAKALNLLASNLDTLAGALKFAGQAWLAYKAFDLAGILLQQAAATQAATAAQAAETLARVAGTSAVATNTAAVVANTAAKAANATAAGAAATAATAAGAATAAASAASLSATTSLARSAAGLLRFAGVVGLVVSSVVLLGDAVVGAFRKAGTWIGEGIAKLQGYRDRSQEVLDQQKALEDTARKAAAGQAELTQQLAVASDKALGLSTAARKVVSEFEGMELKGESATAALEKLAKSLDLGDTKGIADAGAALDALALRGKLSAAQISGALGEALKGQDLAAFEARARTAFDASTQGVRRLQHALDAVADESLRRAGSSADELRTGFSKVATSAINDVDALGGALQRLGQTGSDASRLLSGALDKALVAASTERAVQAVIDRLTALGKQGRLTGDDLANGFEKARKKLDELTPGIGSLNEALRAFGIKTREELQATADKLGVAYRLIANSVSVSLADKVKAFNQWRDAAIAANGGVETSQVALQRRILETAVAAKGLGDTLTASMGQARKATDEASTAQERYVKLLQSDPSRLVGGNGLAGIGHPGLNDVFSASGVAKRNAEMGSATTPIDSIGDQIRRTPDRGITRTLEGQLVPPDNSGDWVLDTSRKGEGPFGLGVWVLKPEALARLQSEQAVFMAKARATDPGGFNGAAGYSPFGSVGRSQASAPAAAPQQITINLGSRSATVTADNRSDADALIELLREAQKQGGGG